MLTLLSVSLFLEFTCIKYALIARLLSSKCVNRSHFNFINVALNQFRSENVERMQRRVLNRYSPPKTKIRVDRTFAVLLLK